MMRMTDTIRRQSIVYADLTQDPARSEDAKRCVELLNSCKGEAFHPRITRLPLSDGFSMTCIEPPCGSNTYICQHGRELLFVDSGFALYEQEMLRLVRALLPGFDSMRRRIVVTHPDEDHCGLLRLFDEVYVSRETWKSFALENCGKPNLREQNPVHAAYTRFIRTVSHYRPPHMQSLHIIEGFRDDPQKPVCRIGALDFCGCRLDIYRGNGGHARGEIAIADEKNKMLFCGDIVINSAGFTPPQAEFNRIAPRLMDSVNEDSAKASQERAYLLRLFPREKYTYCCGHGKVMQPINKKQEDEHGYF